MGHFPFPVGNPSPSAHRLRSVHETCTAAGPDSNVSSDLLIFVVAALAVDARADCRDLAISTLALLGLSSIIGVAHSGVGREKSGPLGAGLVPYLLHILSLEVRVVGPFHFSRCDWMEWSLLIGWPQESPHLQMKVILAIGSCCSHVRLFLVSIPSLLCGQKSHHCALSRSVGIALRIYESMLGVGSLGVVALRSMHRLWLKVPSVFPRLQVG